MAGPQPDQLVKMLQESQEVITALERHDTRELFKKMFRMCLVPASQNNIFNSLDLDRLDSELKVRYLLRLVCAKIREDGSVWNKFLKFLTKIGNQELSDNLSKQYTHKSSNPLESKQGDKDTVFGLQDVKLLLELLVEVSHRWERVGLALGLPKYKIEACRGNDNVISLSNILTCWICADDNIPAKTSLSRLKKALSGDIVGECRVALNLDKEVHKARQTDTPVLAKQADSKPILSIVDQSYDTEVADGRATLLYVQASFTESVSYQWNKDGEPLANCCTYCGVEEDMLIITSARQGVQGNYTCCVSYQEQKAASNDITLTLIYTLAKKRMLNLYSVQSEVPQDSWPPVGTKTFINLVLIKKIRQQSDPKHYALSGDADKVIAQKERIEYSEVFGEYKSSELVLVEGRPGSGKTTLVHKIIKDWTNGLVLREADLVFLITLRFANKSAGKEFTFDLYGQLKYRDEELKAFAGEMERQDGEGVCFVVDGLDEYHCQDKRSSIVYQLLDKSYLSKSMVIVTSRPAAAADLKESVLSKRIETFGFSKEQILEYIDYFPFANSSLESAFDCSYSSSLKEYLHSHPSIFNMCFLPVHAAMISFLYKIKGGNIPVTQTKIYEEFIRSMILRHLRRQDVVGIKISSLKELGGEAKKNFDTLCFLAYFMSTREVQVISREELSCEFSLDVSSDDSWSLGLVTVNSTAQLSGMDKLYTFLHLTFQEFLSAYYIASLDTEKQVELLTMNAVIFQRTLSATTLTFFYGLVNFEGKEYLLHKVTPLFEGSLSVLLSMAFESQQQHVCDILVELRNGRFDIHDSKLSAMDLSNLEYVASTTSKSITEIELSIANTVQTLQNFPRNLFTELIFEAAISNSTEIALVCDALKCCKKVKKLCLHLDGISIDDCQCVADVFHGLTGLQELSLCCSEFSEGIMSLLSGLHNISGLQLNLEFEDLCQGGCREISRGLQLLSGAYLLHFDVAESDIGLDDAMALAEALHCHLKLLTSLGVNNNTISSLGASIVASALQTPSSLTYLKMSHSCLDDEGAINLAAGIKFMPFLESLYLNDNSFGFEGATALGNEMQYLTELHTLKLSDNNVGPCGAYAIACGIAHCTKLKELYMRDTNIDLESVTQIILSLKNSHIQVCDFSIDEKITLSSTFGVGGLIFPEDEREIITLKAAAQHPTCERTIDLGFGIITINPEHKK